MAHHLAASEMTPEAFAASSSAAAFAGAAAAGAVAVFDKLAALEVARRLEWDRRRMECQEAADPGESVKSFLGSWVECERSIRCGLFAMYTAAGMPTAASPETAASGSSISESMSNLSTSDSTPSTACTPTSLPDAVTVIAGLDAFTADILNMERSAASASYYLPTYDQKKCALLVASLRAEMDEARKVLLPKRKFAFSKKVSRTRTEPPTATAETASTANGTTAPSLSSTCHTATNSSSSSSSTAHQPSQPAADQSQGSAGTAGSTAAATAAAVEEPDSHSFQPNARDIALVQSGRGLMNVTDRVIVLSGEQLEGGEFVLLGLQRCSIYLLGRLTMLRISRLQDCKIFAGPITGPCFVDAAQRCTFVIASYQVRIHRAQHSDFYLRVRSKPIIEHSLRLRFAPYCLEDEGVQSRLAAHRLGVDVGLWCEVDDFGWIKAVQSPNWCVLPVGERLAGVRVPDVGQVGSVTAAV
ncbi:MAG: hypothetical protein WDW38_008499 [Sanguina aurantia]